MGRPQDVLDGVPTHAAVAPSSLPPFAVMSRLLSSQGPSGHPRPCVDGNLALGPNRDATTPDRNWRPEVAAMLTQAVATGMEHYESDSVTRGTWLRRGVGANGACRRLRWIAMTYAMHGDPAPTSLSTPLLRQRHLLVLRQDGGESARHERHRAEALGLVGLGGVCAGHVPPEALLTQFVGALHDRMYVGTRHVSFNGTCL